MIRISFLIVINSILYSQGLLIAQPNTHVHPTALTPTAIEPPGVVDGSKDPQKIPDLVAYRLFFLAISEPAEATSEQSLRQAAKILPLQLHDKDRAELISVLAVFQRSYSDIEKRYKASDSAALGRTTSDFLAEQGLLVQNVQAALLSRMSSGGFMRLHGHIQREKARMRIIPFPKM